MIQLGALVDKYGSNYPKGSAIFRQGDDGQEMYFVHSGRVKICLQTPTSEQILATLNAGDFFGEMALFTSNKRSATAIALQDSVIIRVEKASIENMLQNQEFAMRIVRKLAESLYDTNKQISELVAFGRDTQIMKLIISYWKDNGGEDPGSGDCMISFDLFINLAVSQLSLGQKQIHGSLRQLRENKKIDIRKDRAGKLYITFSPQIIQYFSEG